MTNEALLITAAVFLLTFGVFVTLLERIRHPPATPVLNFTGIAGVYLGLCAFVERSGWLYLPCLVLLVGFGTIQLRGFRRSSHNRDNGRTSGTA